MIDLIRDQAVWDKNQIRKRTEALIKREQTHGDEQILNRINDAALLGLRQVSASEEAYRNTVYLPVAMSAGEVATQMALDNVKLAKAIQHQVSLMAYREALAEINSEDFSATIEVSEDETMPNPVIAVMEDTLAELQAYSMEDWILLAQRLVGTELVDTDLDVAVVNALISTDLIRDYLETSGIVTAADDTADLETYRTAVIEELTYVETDDTAQWN
jgi:hypothetical protein